MFWDTTDTDLATESLRVTFLDVFDPSQELPAQAESDLAMLSPFISRGCHGVECFVRVRLASRVTKTRTLFKFLSSCLIELRAWTSQELVVRGIEILGREQATRERRGLFAGEMKNIRKLCDALPSDMEIDMQCPQHHGEFCNDQQKPVVKHAFRSFFIRFAGFEGSEFHGRMRVLDFIDAFPGQAPAVNKTQWVSGALLSFNSFCSLLPYSRSVQEVRVRITTTYQMLWLAYALYHPAAKRGNWRTLVLESCYGIDWTKHQAFLHGGKARLGVFKTPVETTLEFPAQTTSERESRQDTSNGDTGFIWRTATVSTCTKLFSMGETGKPPAVLQPGERVDVCTAQDNEHLIVVVAPGYGLGKVLRRHLTDVTEMHSNDCTSCVRSFYLESFTWNVEILHSVSSATPLNTFAAASSYRSCLSEPHILDCRVLIVWTIEDAVTTLSFAKQPHSFIHLE